VAGFAAMLLTAALGTAMGLNNTAAFMASCVAFVAVSKGMESHLARRRREAAARLPGQNQGDSARALDADNSERDGRA
jgi:chloramphenicol 3-O-phosphotransferase